MLFGLPDGEDPFLAPAFVAYKSMPSFAVGRQPFFSTFMTNKKPICLNRARSHSAFKRNWNERKELSATIRLMDRASPD